MTNETKWGEPLTGLQIKALNLPEFTIVRHYGETYFVRLIKRHCSDQKYQLPADHPYYLATSKGFSYWPGGESAPDDCDGGAVLFRCGTTDDWSENYRWRHDSNGGDIIGYHKKIPAIVEPAHEEPSAPCERTIKLCIDALPEPYCHDGRVQHELSRKALTAMIEPEPEPPVDPDVLAVRKILAGFYRGCFWKEEAADYASGSRDEKLEFTTALDAYREVKP